MAGAVRLRLHRFCQTSGTRTTDAFLAPNTDFVNGGAQHLLMMALVLAACVLAPWYGFRTSSKVSQRRIGYAIAWAICIGITGWNLIRLYTGEYDYTEDLPLDFCNLAALIAPLLIWKPNRYWFQVVAYLVLAGTLNGVLTPDLPEAFPHYSFFKYWLVHGGLVVLMLYIAVVQRYFLDLKGLRSTFIWMNVYFVCMMGLNLLIGANYFYVMAKPPVPTLLDYLGPWPWYLLTGQFLALALFVLIWLPFAWAARRYRPATAMPSA